MFSAMFVFSFTFFSFGSAASFELPSIMNIKELELPSRSTLEASNKIVGGKEVSIKDYPYQVSLVLNRSYFCGGFIISENYILTAGHCTQNLKPSGVVARAGSSWRHNGTIIPIAEVIPHPQYGDPAFDKDVAVLRTANPIEFNDVIQPIKLPPKGRTMIPRSIVQVSGWGKTEYSSNTIPDRLMAVEIPVVSFYPCKLSYIPVLTTNEWCGGHFVFGGKGSCQGDSGGAATQDGMAVGIVSYGRGCASPLSPDVYADIAAPANREFITKTTGL